MGRRYCPLIYNMSKKELEELNTNILGEVIVEYKDGKPLASMFDAKQAVKEITEKVNEIIASLNNK